MKRICCFLIFLTCLRSAALNEPVALPVWDDEKRAELIDDGWIAGGSLLGDAESTEVERFLEQPQPHEMLEMDTDQRLVGEKYIDDYFATRPERFLVDPQKLISRKDRKNLEEFLDYHATDSAIEMFIYVFGAEQDIPGEVREEEVVERHFSNGKPALITYYFLGEPGRSTIYLSPSITDAVSATEQHRALQNSIIRAMKTRSPAKQLEEFLIQMSVRTYWMEQMLDGTASVGMESLPAGETEKSFAGDQDASEENYPAWMVTAFWFAGLAGLAVLVLWSLVVWLRARAKFVFPEFDVESRLGASHAAGVGAVVSFSSPALPPASQRDQVPEYMRRA
jgi:hypothetical protein